MENIPLPGMPVAEKPTEKLVCIDCVAEGLPLKRKATRPGPRCATHKREAKRSSKDNNHETYVKNTYSLSDGEYDRLYELQGGRCAWCRRATGATRKLSVDHDHSCCDGPFSCGHCVRGLLCRPCNDMLGHARDSEEFFLRGIAYLNSPPYKDLLRLIALETLNEES